MIGYLIVGCAAAWLGGLIISLGLAFERGSLRLGALAFAIFVAGFGFVVQRAIDENESAARAEYEAQILEGCTE